MTDDALPNLVVGCGYLGRRVADRWRQQGRSVFAVTRSVDRAEEFRRDGLIPFVADICRPKTLSDLPAVDQVLFAVGYDRASGHSQEDVFVGGLRHVLRQVGQSCRRFISISSTSVYGQQDGSWVDETSPCEPILPGGVCCLAAESLIRQWNCIPSPLEGEGGRRPDEGELTGAAVSKPGLSSSRPSSAMGESPADQSLSRVLAPDIPLTPGPSPSRGEGGQNSASTRAVILRLAGIYGPGRLLSRIADLQAGKPLAGRPDAWLNLIHVDDAVAAVLAAAEAKSPASLYVVTDDQPLNRGDYYSRLAALAGAPPPQFDDSLPQSRGSGELNKRCSNRRMKAELGVTLRYPTIESGLSAALSCSR